MKYLTTTFAIACMAFGFASITATPAQANEASECWWEEGPECATEACSMRERSEGRCNSARIEDIEPLEQTATASPPSDKCYEGADGRQQGRCATNESVDFNTPEESFEITQIDDDCGFNFNGACEHGGFGQNSVSGGNDNFDGLAASGDPSITGQVAESDEDRNRGSGK